MVIKTKDDCGLTLKTLKDLLARPSLSKRQRGLIEDEIDIIASGVRGEQQAAYQIDFHLKDSKNWAVIHDLRIEHNGRVAQIDHLLIGRMLDIFLIESKNFTTAIRMSDEGEFQVKTRYGWRGMNSPVEQNKRHLRVMQELIQDAALAPTRLGIRLKPTYHRWILVPPECKVLGKRDGMEIIRMDMFARRMDDWANQAPLSEMLSIAKIVSSETVMEFARSLASVHKPASFDFAAKFGISSDISVRAMAESQGSTQIHSAIQPEKDSTECSKCNNAVDAKVVNFCRNNKARFEGRILCRECQKSLAVSATCSACGAGIDSKVVAFCRFNSKRFGKRLLCRECQGAV